MSSTFLSGTGYQDLLEDSATFAQLARELSQLGKKKFRSLHKHPYLVLRQGEGVSDEGAGMDPFGLTVSEVSIESLMANDTRSTLGLEHRATALLKSNRNNLSNKITLGRARNNDIIVRSVRISKLHASFESSGRHGGFTLSDEGSTNGTRINGKTLTKGDPRAVYGGDIISLWNYEFEFMEIDSLISTLTELSAS